MQYQDGFNIFDGDGVLEATVTAAVTDILTSNAHGLKVDDIIQLTTSTTLPAGISLTTDYYIIDVTTNTFKIAATPGGTAIDVTGTGTGTHTFHLKGKAMMVLGYRHVVLRYLTTGTATHTVKVQGSTQTDLPQFSAASSAANPHGYLQIIDLEDASAVDGDDGIAVAGTDDLRQFEVNTNGVTWLCANVTSWTAGKLVLNVTGYSNQ